MTRFMPTCESLDARALPSAVMGGVETSLIGLLRTADADPAAANQHGGYDLVKNIKGFTDEPTAVAGILTIQDNALDTVAMAADADAGTHALYQDVFIPAALPDDASSKDAVYLTLKVADAASPDDPLFWLHAIPVDDGTGYDHSKGGGSVVANPDPGSDRGNPDRDDPGAGLQGGSLGGSLAVPADPDGIGMLLPAVQKVR